MDGLSLIVIIILVILITVSSTFLFLIYTQNKNLKKQIKDKKFIEMSEEEAVQKASLIAKNKILEAEKKATSLAEEIESKASQARKKIAEQEKALDEREKKMIERAKTLDARYDQIDSKEKSLEQAKKDVKAVRSKLETQLQEISKLTREEAEKMLKDQVETELANWKAKKVKENEKLIENESEEVSKKILVDVMQNSATDFVTETTTTTITIDDETLKGKIIGKDGRNIRTFEKMTGVDVIIDEAPNQVTLSCFDPIRREVGAITLQRLLKDGRVHPGTIEETVEKVKKELLKEIKKTGEEIAYETGFNDLPQEIIMLLGRFKYRFSYGQNLAKHTLEMVNIGELLAQRLNADVQVTKLACLLHDLGKVAPQEGKQHHHISGEIAAKYFNDDRLINAIEAHHYDIDAKYMESEIVRIADAISGSRPGARRDSYEEYIKRVRALEDIANKHKGVKESFAIRAGREVRVLVQPDKTNDKDVDTMAYDIAKEIEETQNYPGVVKVSVIREYRKDAEAK